MGATYTFAHLLRGGSTSSMLRCHTGVDSSTIVNVACAEQSSGKGEEMA
jgi:hypothetical protein